ncbi:MAG: hypothetical protein WAM92_21950 [Mycobacterium sp.]
MDLLHAFVRKLCNKSTFGKLTELWWQRGSRCREHARRGGFPANSIAVVVNEFGAHSAEFATS